VSSIFISSCSVKVSLCVARGCSIHPSELTRAASCKSDCELGVLLYRCVSVLQLVTGVCLVKHMMIAVTEMSYCQAAAVLLYLNV
jgi:hypothetical protein